MNSAYFYYLFSRGRLDTWWQRWWFLFCLLFQRWATRNLPLEPPRLFLYTQRLRTKLEISIARRYLKWNRHLHSILLTARRNGGSCGSKLGSTLLLFRNFQRKERHTRRLFFFAPSGRAPWKINAFQFTASEDSNKVDTIVVKFDKVEAILKLETPGTKEKIERLNGTANYLAKSPAKTFPSHGST